MELSRAFTIATISSKAGKEGLVINKGTKRGTFIFHNPVLYPVDLPQPRREPKIKLLDTADDESDLFSATAKKELSAGNKYCQTLRRISPETSEEHKLTIISNVLVAAVDTHMDTFHKGMWRCLELLWAWNLRVRPTFRYGRMPTSFAVVILETRASINFVKSLRLSRR